MNADVEDSRIIIEHFLNKLLKLNQLHQRFQWENVFEPSYKGDDYDICVKANKWGQKDRWTYMGRQSHLWKIKNEWIKQKCYIICRFLFNICFDWAKSSQSNKFNLGAGSISVSPTSQDLWNPLYLCSISVVDSPVNNQYPVHATQTLKVDNL